MSEARVGWVAEPDGRGTLGIIWTCLSTLFICIWTSLHLNIPPMANKPFVGTKDRIMWVCANILAPELVSYYAIGDGLLAWLSSRRLKLRGLKNWTMTHSFYANMGGIRLQNQTEGCPSCRHEAIADTVTIETLQRQGRLPEQIRRLKLAEITKHSKADSFTKAIAVFQSAWLIVQSIARTAQRLPLSALEVGTIAYVTCALTNYLTWYYKPMDARTSITIPFKCTGTNRHRVMPGEGGADGGQMISLAHSADVLSQRYQVLDYLFVLMLSSFGAIHFSAWSSEFPSLVELWLWRASCIITTVLPLSLILANSYQLPKFAYYERIADASYFLIYIFYGVGRLVLIVEMFISLRSEAPAVYRTVQWSKLLPHFG
ncbi:hypothetical protein GQ53DRAFT_884815 [Thozetella sp. PMI_491]|nr:hypothetical protein GQ53DRAFT_884815 [Thozetella sp. PMI_491]